MTTRSRAVPVVLAGALAALLVLAVLTADRGLSRPAGARAAGAVVLSGPSTVEPGARLTLRVRVAAKAARGKVALQVRRGTAWRTWRTRALPEDGRLTWSLGAPGGAGTLRLRARVGPRTSRVLTVSVRRATSPSPSPSESPLPEPPPAPAPSDHDPRCAAQFGDGRRVLEQEHRIRPTGFPRTPPMAVLCRLVRVSDTEEYGCYATDPGTKIFDVFWYYDHAIADDAAGYAPLGDGREILTGVVGDASFYIQQDVFDQYYVVWARDGEYHDTAAIVC